MAGGLLLVAERPGIRPFRGDAGRTGRLDKLAAANVPVRIGKTCFTASTSLICICRRSAGTVRHSTQGAANAHRPIGD